MVAVVVQIDAYDPVAAATVTLRAASHDDPSVCHLNAQTWWPVLAKLPTLRYDLFDGAFGGQITAPTSTLSLSTEPWPLFGRYTLADARLQIWTGEPGAAWAAWTQRFDGRIAGQPQLKDTIAEIQAAVDDRWLDTSLLTTYAGTGGAEGPAALKGQPKPLALGAPAYVPGKLIDSANSVFQLSAYGAVSGITVATERLLRFGASVGDYASYAALVAASIPPGRWATANAAGMARFGAPPNGQISFLLQGDAAGPNGWARTPGQLIRRIALLAGGAGKIDDASLNALDSARPYNVSVYLDQQATPRDLIQRIAASVNAVAGVSWLGKLFVLPIQIGTPALTLNADGSTLPQIEPAQQVEVAAPWRKLSIGAERAWTVYALADIAFNSPLLDLGDWVSTTTYREGNLVQNQASTWRYINPTPTAGNPPPTLPTTSNTYWKVLAKAGDPGTNGSNGAAGPAVFTLAGNATLTNNSASKPSGSAGYDTQAYTVEGWRAGCQLSFRVPALTILACGINADPTTDALPGSIDYAFDLLANGNVRFRESGTLTAPSPAITYAAGDLFQIVYDNAKVVYLQNGMARRTVTASANLLFYMDSSLNSVGAQITQIAWSAAGAAGVSPISVSAQPDAVQVQTDANGSAAAGQLPATIANTATQGTSNVAITSITIVSTSACSASVSGSTVKITAISGTSGEVAYDVVAAGQTVRKRVSYTVVRSGGSGGTSATLAITGAVASSTYAQDGGTITLAASSAGKIAANLTGGYTCADGSTIALQTKVQYRLGTGSWIDVSGSENTGSTSYYEDLTGGEQGVPPAYRQTTGYIASAGPYTLTGLTAGSVYEFRAMARIASGNATTTNGVSFKLYAEQAS